MSILYAFFIFVLHSRSVSSEEYEDESISGADATAGSFENQADESGKKPNDFLF